MGPWKQYLLWLSLNHDPSSQSELGNRSPDKSAFISMDGAVSFRVDVPVAKEEKPKIPKYPQTKYVSDPSPVCEFLCIHPHHTSYYIQMPFSSGLSCDGTVFDESIFF